MDLDFLKSLISVAETGSFSRAATKLCVSQSAVSKRIKQLEETLGFSLFDRSGQQLQLTQAGNIVYKNAQEVMRICSQCSLELSSLLTEKKISFCCTPSYSVSHLSHIVRELMERRPDINKFTFALHNLETILENLRANECHLAVVEHCDAIPIPTDIETENLDFDEMIFITHPSWYGLHDSSISNVTGNTIYVRSGGCCSRKILESVLFERSLSLDDFTKVFVCDDLNLNLRAVIAGEGIAYVPTMVAKPYIQQGLLRTITLDGFNKKITRSLLKSQAFFESKESLDLIRVIRDLTTT